MTGIDIFSGAGGLSLGAEWAGIKVLCAIEKDYYSAKTYATNHPDTKVIIDDIKNVNPLDMAKKEEIFILFGGPPCQGFSTSNRKTRNDNNLNNSLFREFLRFTTALCPKWILFENVEGITNYNKGETLKYIKQSFMDLGYMLNDKILYASDYGVPQHRNRFFIVGNRKNIPFIFPDKMNTSISVGEAINDLPLLNNGDSFSRLPYRENTRPSSYAKKMRTNSKISTQNIVSKSLDYVIERYRHIQQGQNWKAIPSHLMSNYKNTNNCHSGIYKRLKIDEPSIVISNYRKNMLIHPTQDRGLSVREAARIQSFPDDFIFEGSIHYIQQQIGNAVPPLLAEAIFKQILTLNRQYS
jgi:DNA (cytosine-5)-methyltransferase 1